ncbi:MAG: hypothetical protein AAGC77_05030 [Pseudomonadota bacterium]
MIDALEFFFILLTFAVILGWYLQNVRKGGGSRGLLAMKDEPPLRERRGAARAYRHKPKYARTARDGRTIDAVKANTMAEPAYRSVDKSESANRRYRPRHEARYKNKSIRTS